MDEVVPGGTCLVRVRGGRWTRCRGRGTIFEVPVAEDRTTCLGRAGVVCGWRIGFGQAVPGSENPERNQTRSLPTQTPIPSYGRGRDIRWDRQVQPTGTGVELEVSTGAGGSPGRGQLSPPGACWVNEFKVTLAAGQKARPIRRHS